MDTARQLPVFLLCVSVGVLGGVLYEPFSLLGKCFKKCRAVFDTAFFVAFALLCVLTAAKYELPSFRGYMYLGNAIGGIIYLKSFHRIVAFFENMCYNRCIKAVKRRKRTKTRNQTR